MSRALPSLLALLLAVPGSMLTGADGYLRQGPPPPLRFAKALIPPPPVNELILALGKPPQTDSLTPTNDTPEVAAALPTHLQPFIEDLISRPAPVTTVVDTAAPTVASTPDSPPPLPEISAPTPPPADMANQLGELLLLFNGNRRGNGRGDPAVVVAPPTFLPPQTVQPAPSSRAVYRTQ